MTAEEVTYNIGNRDELFILGSHSTHVLIGNMSYETELGVWKARALLNTLEVSPVGITASALVGNVTLNAVAGAAIMKGTVAALVESAGPVQIRSAAVVLISSPGNGLDIGPVLCGGSREPFTNLPFITWGLGAKTTLVTN